MASVLYDTRVDLYIDLFGIKTLSQLSPILVSYNSRSAGSAAAAHSFSQALNYNFQKTSSLEREYLLQNLALHRRLSGQESIERPAFSIVRNNVLGPTDITHIAERGVMLEVNDALFVDEYTADGSPSFCWFDMRYNFEKLEILKNIIGCSLEQFY